MKQLNDASEMRTSLSPLDVWLKIKYWINRVLMSPWWGLSEFALAAFIIAFDLEVVGALVFVWIIVGKLALCRDILAPFLPFCLTCVFVSDCYDSADIFLPYIWMAVPVVAAVVTHLIVYRPERLRIGPNFWGSVAVTVAVTLGGVGTISVGDYFYPTALYYVGFLGLGMLLAYVVTGNYIREREEYDVFHHFGGALYAMGILACFSIGCFYVRDWSAFIETKKFIEFQCSNNLATMLMIAMPFPCYFAARKSRVHLLGLVAIFGGVVLSGSRGGLLMGTVELFICIIYLCYADRKIWYVYALGMAAMAVALWYGVDYALEFYSIDDISSYIGENEVRVGLLKRMWSDFSSNYVFGTGLGYRGNEDLYNPVKGAMHWYHMMIPQIIASLGACGVVAYLAQFGLRVYTVFRRVTAYKLVVGLSYVGLLLMSQVNPGEFCPIPYALIGVMLFVMAELRDISAQQKNKINE